MNNVNLIARLTAKPEIRHTNNGKAVCNFTVAVDRKFKDADGNAVTDYIDGVAWNNQAEFLCKWFDKGVRVGITGELQTRRYEKDGQTHKVTEVLVSTVEFADGKREANANTDTNTFTEDTNDDFVPLDSGDDLPF
jgi:single-strand DNA-binding protein